MKRGFTLVELSIVLVIIGLLIGGILAAQSMISAAKIVSFTKQISDFDIAIENFRTRYKFLPGDDSGSGGNQNDRVEDGFMLCCSGQNTSEWNWETSKFWPTLQTSGFMQDKPVFQSTVTGTFRVDGSAPNSPQMTIAKGAGVVPYFGSGAGLNSTAHYYFIADFTAMGSVAVPSVQYPVFYEAIPAVQALAIDTKLDDGLPGANQTTANVIDAALPGWNLRQTDTCSQASGYTKYNTTSKTAKCGLMIKMLTNTGTN